jgi:uncharacterized phosphosugar-binding protein
MKEIQGYFDVLQSKLQSCMQTQKEAIDQAADMIVDSFLKGGRFYAFGTGHSHLIVEELYTRAGGLAFVKPILPTEMMLHEMPTKSSALERLPGYAKAILDLYPVEENDVFLIISNSGRNSAPVEMAMERMNARGNGKDAFENEPFLQACASIYSDMEIPWLFRIEADGEIEETQARVRQVIRPELGV